MNRPGSYEAFLEMFAPDAYFRLVARPSDTRRRVQIAAASVLVVVLLAVFGWALVSPRPSPSQHIAAGRHHHHRHAVTHPVPDRDDESLGRVV